MTEDEWVDAVLTALRGCDEQLSTIAVRMLRAVADSFVFASAPLGETEE